MEPACIMNLYRAPSRGVADAGRHPQAAGREGRCTDRRLPVPAGRQGRAVRLLRRVHEDRYSDMGVNLDRAAAVEGK